MLFRLFFCRNNEWDILRFITEIETSRDTAAFNQMPL